MTDAAPLAGLDRRCLLQVALCSIVFFLDCLIPALMGSLAAPIAHTLQLSRPDLGTVFSANLLGQCIGLVLVPLLARRTGHRRVIIASCSGFGAVEILTAFAAGRDSLALAHLVAGFFLGGALPSGLAVVTQAAPAARRGLATMLLFTGYGLGGAAAGFLASAFVAGERWRIAFLGVGVACLLAALVMNRWLREVETRAERPRRVLEILRPPLLSSTLLLWLLFICALTIYYGLSSWLPTLLVDLGRNPRLAAQAIGSYTSGGVLAGLLIGPLIDRYGARPVLSLFFGIAAILLFVVGRNMDVFADPTLLALLATCGFFMLGGYGGLNVILAASYPGALRAIGVGWAKSVSRIATVLTPIAIGHALSEGVRPEVIVSAFAAPAAIMLVALVAIRRS